MAVAAIILGLGLRSLKLRKIPTSLSGLWKLGFGSLTPFTYLVIGLPREDPAGLISNVLLANLPQLILSILYIFINAMLSTFLVQREFSRMHVTRKPLRVSEPRGIQRSSFFISLPLRYGIPLYASSGLMHWLISQSLFLARIAAIKPDGTTDAKNSFSTCGASPIAVVISKSYHLYLHRLLGSQLRFVAILVGLTILLSVVALGCQKYDGTMRMVATNSMAISAACHVLEKDRTDGYMLPVTWGVIEEKDGKGNCAVTTAAKIKKPREGVLYQ